MLQLQSDDVAAVKKGVRQRSCSLWEHTCPKYARIAFGCSLPPFSADTRNPLSYLFKLALEETERDRQDSQN